MDLSQFPCSSQKIAFDLCSQSVMPLSTPLCFQIKQPCQQVEKGMLSMYQAHKLYAPDTTKQTRLIDNADSTDVTHCSLQYQPTSQHCPNEPLEHLDLTNFKTYPCKQAGQHNHKQCPFYHNIKDKKRMGNFYSAEICHYIEQNEMCPYNESCIKAHSRVEQLYKPDKYKTKFCTFYPYQLGQCEYGAYCSFAHSEDDIYSELIHNLEFDQDFFIFYYKTVWCPFNLTQHDKDFQAQCVYAHNWQDFRRKPNIYQYTPQACPNWDTKNFIIEYADGCANGFQCSKCHGWKEFEYHPYLYKSKQCPNLGKCNRIDCSNYHDPCEKRNINENVLKRIFKLVPRNRITRNVFKVRDFQMQMLMHNQEITKQCDEKQNDESDKSSTTLSKELEVKCILKECTKLPKKKLLYKPS